MKNIFFAIYDDKDMIVTTFDNYREMAIFFEKSTTDTLKNAVNRKHKVRLHDKWYEIYKVDEREIV